MRSLDFIKDIGHRIVESTGEKKATAYLMQAIGMAIQRGNRSCITNNFVPGYLGIMATRHVQFCYIFAVTKDKFDYF